MAWLSWPLIYWSGHAGALPAGAYLWPGLHGLIVGKMRSAPRGLYVLQLAEAGGDGVQLIAVTGPRLASAAHMLALAERADVATTRAPEDTLAIIQRARARVEVLGRCLRELEEVLEESGRQPTLRRLAWKVDARGVEAPLELMRCLRNHPGIARPTAGVAIMEFVLRAGSSANATSEFIDALEEVIAECDRMEEEPRRRRQVFCSLLKEAMTMQPAYVRVFFSAPGKVTVAKWKSNGEFECAAVKLFFERHLPETVARTFSERVRTRYTFEQMSEWLVGLELPPFKHAPLPDSLEPPDAIGHLLEALGEGPAAVPATARMEILNLVTCWAATTGDPQVPRLLARWLQTCREIGKMNAGNDNAWGSAVSSLRRWITESGSHPDHLRRLAELLPARGIEIFCRGWIQHVCPAGSFWKLARLGDVPLETALAIFDLDLIETVHDGFDEPGRVEAFIALVVAHRNSWSRLGDWEQRRWILLFAKVRHRALVTRLLDWTRFLEGRGFTFQDVTSLVVPVVDFLTREPEPGSRVRETFLFKRFCLLDRTLQEIETTLRGLPAMGYDEWRSHGELWRVNFGICEILFHWNAARFPHEQKMTEEVFAWSRKRDRAAMADGDVPRNRFYSLNGYESLLVRLSGGQPPQLLALIEEYSGPSEEPNNPLHGWNFLDRYPAVQESLQTICRRAWRLHSVLRILRELALAIRLQRRAFLLERLDQWLVADASDGPVEKLGAFGRLAGYADPLPSAVERVLAREQGLQRERDTLRGMAVRGQITPSAARRLAKLDLLLTRPSAIAEWVERDLRRKAEKILTRLKVTVLGFITRQAIRSHWKDLVDADGSAEGQNWDNALQFYYRTDRNKAVLRKLLQHAAGSDQHWRLRHAPNAKFIADLRANGLDADAWLEPFRVATEVHGATWTVYLEQDPLRVLQMGNLFGTCLSFDDFNAFAAIANAVEVNKQVLYLEDDRGTVIGRKLIGLTSDGRFFGFHSYGAACLHWIDKPEKPQAWIKILFDLACLQLVRRVKGKFDQTSDSIHTADDLRLAADWYDDGPEPFDWWIAQPDLAEDILHATREPVAMAVHRRLEESGLGGPDDMKSSMMETLRAMLWLRDEGAPLVEKFGRSVFTLRPAHFLRCQTQSELVRAMLQGF